MRCIAAFLLSVVLPLSGIADDPLLSQVATGLSVIAESLQPVAVTGQNGHVVTLSYNTRTFMVHSLDKAGNHSRESREEVGPKHDGLIVQVTVQDGRYAGAAEIPQDLRRPYWTTFVNAYPIAGGKQHLHVNISYGSSTDRNVIQRVKDLLESMVDDEPAVKATEIESHNKPVGDKVDR